MDALMGRLRGRAAGRAAMDWRRAGAALVLGQVLSLCITGTSVISKKLAGLEAVTAPCFQSSIAYAMLLVVYMPLALVRLGPRAMWANIRRRAHWFVLLAAVDVEGNYFVVKAYSYTSLLSCMLLDTWTLPCVMVLGFFVLRARFRWMQILGVLMCLGGMGMLVKGDMDGGKNYAASDAVRGDIYIIIGATCYALSNTLEEFIVRHRPQYETVAWLGLFATIINGVQMAALERDTLRSMPWSGPIVGYSIGFGLVMFVLYTLVPFLFRLSSATFYNLSILTSDFWGIVFAKYLFGDTITPIYGGAFVLIVCGLVAFHAFPHPAPLQLVHLPGFRTPVAGDRALGSAAPRPTIDDEPHSDIESVSSTKRRQVADGALFEMD
ncbi:hypothetical protein H4R19_001550 [Coemansia spiralis]|nr:hypothetical protein H4R19_001550 [Coemansia spiralis]